MKACHTEDLTQEWLDSIPKAKVKLGLSRSWSNENPGEGGSYQTAELAEDFGQYVAGTPVILTGNGHSLVPTDGGWKSVHAPRQKDRI